MHLIYKCDYCNCSFSGKEICEQHEEKCKPRMSVVEKRQFITKMSDNIVNSLFNDTKNCLNKILKFIHIMNSNEDGSITSSELDLSDYGFERILEILVEIESENIPKEIETEHIVDRCCYMLLNHIKRINLD